jgi:diacylglycerol kinase family enzyme
MTGPVPIQVDGDFIGTHEEAVFTVRPGGLLVLGGDGMVGRVGAG